MGASSCMRTLLCLVAQSHLTLCNPTDCSRPGSSVHGESPSKNSGVGCHALLQGIFRPENTCVQTPWVMDLCHLRPVTATGQGTHAGVV